MFLQIFLSPQVERRAIVTYEHGIYELPHYSGLSLIQLPLIQTSP